MNMSPETPALELVGVEHSYRQGPAELSILRGVNLTVMPGQSVALIAPSGVGKSTLLHIAGLLEKPVGGDVLISGNSTSGLNDTGRTRLRRNSIGFVYQFHHLQPEFSALENVILPQLIRDRTPEEAQARATELLTSLGLAHRLEHRPAKLSGGEQQRVAVGRALANKPLLVLADEPTGNLDEKTADAVFGEFLRLVREQGSAALVATHNERLAARMDRVFRLHEGLLE